MHIDERLRGDRCGVWPDFQQSDVLLRSKHVRDSNIWKLLLGIWHRHWCEQHRSARVQSLCESLLHWDNKSGEVKLERLGWHMYGFLRWVFLAGQLVHHIQSHNLLLPSPHISSTKQFFYDMPTGAIKTFYDDKCIDMDNVSPCAFRFYSWVRSILTTIQCVNQDYWPRPECILQPLSQRLQQTPQPAVHHPTSLDPGHVSQLSPSCQYPTDVMLDSPDWASQQQC